MFCHIAILSQMQLFVQPYVSVFMRDVLTNKASYVLLWSQITLNTT